MVYWSFTAGKSLLGGCLAPLLCLIPLAPVMAAGLMGCMVVGVANVVLHDGLRQGGWLWHGRMALATRIRAGSRSGWKQVPLQWNIQV